MQVIDNDMKLYAESLMKRFKLVDMRNNYLDIIAEAESENLSYLEFFVTLIMCQQHTSDLPFTIKIH